MTIYILGESTAEQTIVNGKPSFTKPLHKTLKSLSNEMDQDKLTLTKPEYDHKWFGVYNDKLQPVFPSNKKVSK